MGVALLGLRDPLAADEFLKTLDFDNEGAAGTPIVHPQFPPTTVYHSSPLHPDVSVWLYLAEAATLQRDWDIARMCYDTVIGVLMQRHLVHLQRPSSTTHT